MLLSCSSAFPITLFSPEAGAVACCCAAGQLYLFPALMLSRKCTGQFFQVLPRAGGGKGCAPGHPPRQPGCGATFGMGGG